MNNWQQQRQQHEEPLLGTGTVTATFRPNLSGFTPSKIRLPSYGSNNNNNNDDSHSASNEHTNNNNNDAFLVVRVNATNDFATANYENEVISHWIDVHFLEASLGQQQAKRILSQLDATPCRKLLGTYSGGGGRGEQVLGTLSFPLYVSCQFDQEVTLMDAAVAAGVGPRKRHPELLKKQERLLQSTRTFSSTDAVDNDDASQRERQLELLAQPQQQQGINDNSTATGPLGLSPGWVNLVLSKHTVVVVQNLPVPFHISFRAIRLMPSIVPALSPLSPSLFPEHYQSHTYWTNGVAQQLQELARQHRREQQQQQQQKRVPTPPLDVKTCACCRQPNPRVRCGGGCQDVFYCDKICQQGHWKLHKKTCPQQEQASIKTAVTTSSSHSATSNSKKEPNTNGKNINGKKKWWNKS